MRRISEMNPHERHKAMAECMQRSLTRDAFDKIVAVEAKIHRIKLSGEKIKGQKMQGLYDYDSFKKIFPKAGFNSEFVPDDRMPNYNVQLTVDMDMYKLNIFTYRNKGCCPPFCLDVTPKECVSLSDFYNSLIKLNNLIPNMCVSSVENTIDIYCDTPADVEWLFWLLRRAVFIPYAKDATQNSIDTAEWNDKLRLSMFQHYGGDTKIYPRGNDCDKKKGKGWPLDTFNRVRLEYTPDRRMLLNKFNIDKLSDFLRDCKFQDINGMNYNFRRFEGSGNYPEYYEDDWSNYSAEDKNGNTGAFQNEYILRSVMPETKNNYRKYVVDIEDFEPLKEKLINAMKILDLEWGVLSII
ncbi:hypothetical protein [Pelobacter propionicus]|nr:hypothetical protein [Pelobacter propionicus]